MIATVAMMLSLAASPAVQAQAGSTPAAKPEKKICRRIETTGSLLPGKSTCHTKSEWAQIDQSNSEGVSAAQSSIRMGAGGRE